MRKNSINRFKQMNIIGNELEDIFIPEKRKISQTCHKIRLKTLISKYDSDQIRRENICFCQSNRNQNQHQYPHHLYIPQDEEQNILSQNVEENEIEPEIKPQKNEEGNQYVTKKEFNEFKEHITKEIKEVKTI